LSFDQFRRSALLAQGEFAAFLRADEKDRASLLEQMTGSEIYSQVSIAAFQRGAEERAKLEALAVRLADLVVLEPNVREELTLAAGRLAREVDAARQAVAQLEEVRRWYQAGAALRGELAAAEAEARGASKRWDAGVAERELLAAVRRVRPVEGPIRAADGARKALESAIRELAAAQADEAGHLVAVEDAERAFKVRASDAETAERAAREREPEVREAKALDAQLAVSDVPLKAAEEIWKESAAAAKSALHRVAKAPLPRGRAEPPFASRVPALAESCRASTLALEESERALLSAKVARERADAALAEVDMATLRAEREAFAARQAGLASLHGEHQAVRRLGETVSAAQLEIASAEADAARAVETKGSAHAATENTRARLEEARRSLALALGALDLAGRRAELRAGEACPLCGSEEHPWRDGSAPGSPVVEQLQVRAESLAHELVAQEKGVTTASVEASRGPRRRARLRRGRRGADRKHSTLARGGGAPTGGGARASPRTRGARGEARVRSA
jgi:exonuclease SbcC